VGTLWTVSRHLGLGLTVDTPWTVEGTQTRTVRNTITTYDATRSNVLNATSSEQVATKDIEFHFPLYCAAGAVWRWSSVLYSTLDVSQTRWSEFWYRAEGGGKINPLDGSRLGQHRLDDCWTVRTGLEYLWVLSWTEIPLRGGVSWEQRPAIGDPDEYWGVSLGSGLSLGKDPGKLIVDLAYNYTWGNDVLGSLVPEQPGLKTDVRKHQGFLSCIWHF
jgi:long-subunit fatty acid transport protein